MSKNREKNFSHICVINDLGDQLVDKFCCEIIVIIVLAQLQLIFVGFFLVFML